MAVVSTAVDAMAAPIWQIGGFFSRALHEVAAFCSKEHL